MRLKQVLEKLVALNTYLRKDMSQTNDLSFHLKKIENMRRDESQSRQKKRSGKKK